MWTKEGKDHHLLSADGSRYNCPFSAGKLPQGIVLGRKTKSGGRSVVDEAVGAGKDGAAEMEVQRARHQDRASLPAGSSGICDPGALSPVHLEQRFSTGVPWHTAVP